MYFIWNMSIVMFRFGFSSSAWIPFELFAKQKKPTDWLTPRDFHILYFVRPLLPNIIITGSCTREAFEPDMVLCFVYPCCNWQMPCTRVNPFFIHHRHSHYRLIFVPLATIITNTTEVSLITFLSVTFL